MTYSSRSQTLTTAPTELKQRLTHLPAYAPVRLPDEVGDRTYNTPLGNLAGVTTILSGSRDNNFLKLWREDIGEERADFIRDLAAYRGTAHHSAIEKYLLTGILPSFSFLSTPYWNSSWPFLQTIKTPLLQEGALWHPLGFAGTCDCIAYLADDKLQPTMLDWKTADKPADKRKLYDYCLQVAAYVAAANYVYGSSGLNITRAAIVIAVRARPYQVEWLGPRELSQYFKHFEARLKRYTFARTRRSPKK